MLPPEMKRWILIVVGSVIAAELALCAGAYWAMRQPPAVFGRIVARVPTMAIMMAIPFETLWTRARRGSLGPGDPAPDFILQTLDRSSSVRLSDLRGRPVVLVFGSYT
jgi:hypothetical protein